MVDIGSLSAKKNKHKEDGLGVNMWWGMEAGRGSAFMNDTSTTGLLQPSSTAQYCDQI